ncbi:MAG: cyclopropane-fatty-acyl-phospholipid synthase family protein [Gammaproteobacteria bacterium]|nr:cyclopropane-fatty-acyl-phospholipid synthase family protein [Gammaproteobacteria bacterium]
MRRIMGMINKRLDSEIPGGGACASQQLSFVKTHDGKSPVFYPRVSLLDRWLVRKMLDVVGNPPVRISLWDGKEVTPHCKNPVAVMVYRTRGSLLKTIIDPELYWGDLYCAGDVEFTGDMAEFLAVIYRGISSKGKPGWLRSLVLWAGHRNILNTLDRARENIHYHYDIGNDFYRLWLDRAAMQYTCAYFPYQNMTLEQAQMAKLHHICHKLKLKSGDHVVEAGCGWGGLALFMARHYGVKVTAYNISGEQIKYARQRAEKECLDGQVEYVLDDYRNIEGQFDVFVSVGMLEHVGKSGYRELGEIIRSCLKPDGRGLIHSIGRMTNGPMNAWIERRIFPGACPPALSEMMQIFEPNNLAVYDVENLRLHYARTLELWAQRFESHEQEIIDMTDETFVKAWGLYLHGSRAAFSVGELQLFQVLFNHAENNNVPWSRQYIYESVENSAAEITSPPEISY